MFIDISCVTACHESNLSSTFQISDLVAYVGGFTILGFPIGIYLYHRPLVDINDSQMIVVLELLQTQVSESEPGPAQYQCPRPPHGHSTTAVTSVYVPNDPPPGTYKNVNLKSDVLIIGKT